MFETYFLNTKKWYFPCFFPLKTKYIYFSTLPGILQYTYPNCFPLKCLMMINTSVSYLLYLLHIRPNHLHKESRVQRFGQVLRKMRIRISDKVQNKILRPVYEKTFFNILPHSFRILVQSF